MQLIADFGKIEREVGFNNATQTLMSTSTLDAPRDASPILVKHDRGYYLLVFGFEAGNFSAGGVAQDLRKRSDVQVIFYRPYFTWETIDEDRRLAQDEAGALAQVAPPGSPLEVDADVPLDRYRKFASRFQATVKEWKEPGNFQVYEIQPGDVSSLFGRGLEETRNIASCLLNSLTSLSGADKETFLRIMGEAKDLRFEKLKALMEKNRLPAILSDSRVNIQELTGMPWDMITEDLLALYDGQRVFLLSPQELDLPHGRRIGARGDLNTTLEDLAGPSVGCLRALSREETHQTGTHVRGFPVGAGWRHAGQAIRQRARL